MKNNRRIIFNKRTISNIVVICAGVLLYLGLSNFGAVRSAIGHFFSILSPFVVGLAIAYLLNLPTRFFERHLFAKLRGKRALSILCTYVLAFLVLALLLGMILPQVVESVSTLLRNVTLYLNNLNQLVTNIGARFDISEEILASFLLNYNDLIKQIMAFVRDMLPNLLGYTMRLGSGIVAALTALIASVYFLVGKEKLLMQCRRVLYALLPQQKAGEVVRVGRLSNNVFSGFISGKLLDSAIIGVICFIFMSLCNIVASLFGISSLQMPFTLLISVIIGVTNIIPFFGPFLGAIPAVMIMLMINPPSAIWFGLFIIVLQQFDGNILGPKILGDSTGLPAIWVLIAIIVGGGLFGFLGMLLGVPTAAVLYTLCSDFIEKRLKQKKLNEPADLFAAEKMDSAPPLDASLPDEDKFQTK